MTDTLGLDTAATPAPKKRRRRQTVPDPIAPVQKLTAAGRRNTRRSTFDAPETDLWTKYADIEPRSLRWQTFIEAECMVPNGRNAGSMYKLLPYQVEDLQATDDQLVVILSGPRGVAKSGIGAALLVAALFDRPGVQVIAASTGMRTARIAYDRAVRIIDLNPRLSDQALVVTDKSDPKVTLPTRGSEMLPLPAEEKYIVGGSPYFQLVDEIGYVDDATYEALQTASGKVPGSLTLATGTPGLGTADSQGRANIMYRIRQLALSEDPPPGLRYIEHAAHPNDDPSLESTWRKANPGLGILVEVEHVALDYRMMTPARFGQMRLGLWTQHESAWMQAELWDGLDMDRAAIPDGEAVTLGFDGSTSGDTTALMAKVLRTGRLCVLASWTRPPGQRGWRVPRDEVMLAVDQAFTRLSVIGMLADPWGWQSELQTWARLYNVNGEIVQAFNTASAVRMGPETDAFMADVITGGISWDGTPQLREHVLAAIAKRTAAGDVLVKDARKPQQIDLAIASILANAAARLVEPPTVAAIH